MIALALLACSKEEVSNDQGGNESASMQTVTIKASIDGLASEDLTKAVYSDGQGLNWTSSDAAELGLLSGSSWTKSASTAISIKDDDATFTATVPAEATSFAAYYPASAATVSGSNATFVIPSAQSEASAGASDDKDIPLVSSSVTKLSAGGFKVTMKPAAAIVRFILYSADETVRTQSVTAVTLSGSDNIAGSLTHDFSTGNDTFAGSSKTVTVTLGTAYSLTGASSRESAATKGIYTLVAPGSVLTGFTVSASSGAKSAFTFTQPKTISGKGITNVFVDLSKGSIFVTVTDLSALQATIDACVAGMTVRVGAGTYSGTITLKEGVNVSGSWNNTFTAVDTASSKTILDGEGKEVALTQSAAFTSKTTVSGFTIRNGYSTGNGGCVALLAGVVLDECNIYGGNASQGGGAYINGASVIQNSHVYGNKSTTHGAGIYLNSGASAVNCVSENNVAIGNGGGINVNGSAVIDRCVVRNNKANNGGGISIRSASFPATVLSNSLICGNHSVAASGSGLHMYAQSARPITVYNCTIADNVNDAAGASAYGVLSSDKHLWFANNIVYGNTTSGDTTGKLQVFMNCGEASFSDGPYLYNNAVTKDGIAWKASTKYTASGNMELTAAPYGADFKLSSGSVCINAGLATFAVGPASSSTNSDGALIAGSLTLTSDNLDLSGKSRIQGSAPDLGCYEKE